MIGLMKDGRGVKRITKFTAMVPKSYSYRAYKDAHEIEYSKFIRAKVAKKSGK